MQSMNVWPYTEADFPSVLAVYADAKPAELQFEPQPPRIVALDNDPVILAALSVLVYDDGAVRGFAATFGGQVRAVFVHADARGQGVGTALMGAIFKDARGPLSLNVVSSNLQARTFYERLGFAAGAESLRNYNDIDVRYTQMVRTDQLVSGFQT
ncbi:GNAT family N-acetyltransferase [Duganella sp. CT11-25]|uniref:GNAT family N-acetyltransferase n=2 Tax=unclassified Duganella TaxID=2636909 RepID=UPI0039AF149A